MALLILFLVLALHYTNAQSVIINTERVKRNSNNNGPSRNPFISTTLSTKITYSETTASASSSYLLDFDSTRKSMFTETLAHFLTKIFHDQQVYNVKIISVNIFDDHILKDGHVEELTTQQQVKLQRSSIKGNQNDEDSQQVTLSYSTVVAAEYTNEEDINSIANENFRKMLIHVCDKFQGHLMKYVKDLNDPYFLKIESVVLSDFERYDSLLASSANQEDGSKVLGMSKDTVNVISMLVIAIGGLVTLALLYASVKFYRKEKQLKALNWRSKEIVSLNGAAHLSSINSPGELTRAMHPVGGLDDFSFDPMGLSGYTSGSHSYNGYRDNINDNDDPINNENPSMNDDEEIAFSSVWPQSAPPTLFPVPGSKATPAPAPAPPPPSPPKLSYSEELENLPKQHVFAPPGKIGVAIDVYNGQPTVHKIRKGSPLEKMLQSNDVILAIDDEDTTCLSAADVTSMMVKRMDRVRKITFVRRE